MGVEFQQRQRLEFGGVMTERGRVSGKATTEVKDGSGRSWRKVSEWICWILEGTIRVDVGKCATGVKSILDAFELLVK